MRAYAATFEDVAVAAAQDLFELVASSSNGVLVVGFAISNVGVAADAGDTQEELLQIRVRRGQTSSGSGGSTVTPANIDGTDNTAFAGTCEANNTTQASSGTIEVLHADGWNVRSPYVWIWPEILRPSLKASERLTIELPEAPTDSIDVSGTVWFLELG